MSKFARFLQVILLTVFLFLGSDGYSATFIVNSIGNTGDNNAGDGICNDGSGNCTLRAAVEEANVLNGADLITFAPVLNNSVIAISSVLIIDPIDLMTTTIMGPGADLMTIDGGGVSQIFSIKYGIISGLTLTNGTDGFVVPVISINGTANATLDGMKITNNILDNGMPTVQMNSSGTLNIYNTLIAGNDGGSNNGAGFKMAGGTVNIVNSTIAGNTALYGGGGIRQDGGTLNLSNSIVALNIGGFGPNDIEVNGGTFNAIAPNLIGDANGTSLISDGILIGTTMAPVDPQFTNAGAGDYSLLETSPGNDAGNDANVPPAPFMTDVNGGERIQGAMVDLGAFEFLIVAPIPTLSQWGIIIMGILLLVVGIVGIRNKVFSLSKMVRE